MKKYRNSPKGKINSIRCKAKRRYLGFEPINEHFENSHAHHIDSKHVIYIPRELHKLGYHSLKYPETMEQINTLAYLWVLCGDGNIMEVR